jgi:hypothetical protein
MKTLTQKKPVRRKITGSVKAIKPTPTLKRSAVTGLMYKPRRRGEPIVSDAAITPALDASL